MVICLFRTHMHYFLWYIHYELFLNMRCKIVSYKKIIMCFKWWQIPVVLLTKVLWPDAEDLVLTKSIHQADLVSIIIKSTILNQCMNCTPNYFWFFPHFLPITTKSTLAVKPVSKGCSLLHGNWSWHNSLFTCIKNHYFAIQIK